MPWEYPMGTVSSEERKKTTTRHFAKFFPEYLELDCDVQHFQGTLFLCRRAEFVWHRKDAHGLNNNKANFSKELCLVFLVVKMFPWHQDIPAYNPDPYEDITNDDMVPYDIDRIQAKWGLNDQEAMEDKDYQEALYADAQDFVKVLNQLRDAFVTINRRWKLSERQHREELMRRISKLESQIAKMNAKE